VSCGTGNTSYSHDPDNSNLLSKTGNGVTTLYGNYDPDGNPAFMIEAAGTDEERRTDYSYDPRYHGKVASLTTASVVTGSKKVTNYGYDDFGNRTSVTIDGFDPDGNPVTQTTTYQYNGPLFQLSRVDGPRDNLADVTDITTLRYYTNDPLEGYNRARLKEVEGANGVLLRSNIQYTATGKVSAETRPNGLLMTYSYYPGNDRLEMLAETSPSASRVTRWTYLESGEVASITHGYGAPESTTLTFGYDDARRLISVTDGLGNTIEYVLDTEGNRLEDLYNRIDAAAQANETVQYDYSPEGALSRSVDGKGGVKGFSYDSLMRLSASTQDLGNLNIMTQYSYDAVDRLSTVIDPAGSVTRYVYDDLGNLLSLISPDTGGTTFRYDPAGNLIRKIDAKGQTFLFTYDAINRLVAIEAPGTSDDISYSYDSCTNGAGRLCAVTRGNNVLHYRYTAYGEVASIEQSVTTWSGIQQAHGTLSYSYDATGRLATITYPGGASITYQYDAAGQLGIVNLKVADKQKTLLSNATYLPFGPSANQLLGNGLTVGGWYDQAYRPWVIGGGTFYDALYYDENGNAYTRYMPAGVSNYGYDALNRLGEAVLPVGERSYSYDSNGNRIQLTSDGVTTKYSYTTNSNRLSAIDASVVELDSNGNATNLGGMALDYTTDNRIKSVMRVADYSYNGIGQRIQKSVRASDAAGDYGFGPKRVFLYGKNGELIAESGPGGVVTREYIYVNEQLFALIDHVPDSGELFLNGDMDRDGSITVEDFIEWYFNHYQNGIDVSYEVTGDAVMDQADIDAMLACAINGNCIAASFDTRLYYVHNDHLGTPHALTDETGVKIWSATYDPFGKAIADGDPDGDGTTFTMNIRFPGQYYDQETGLHYNYFRYYDPETGRYLTADPIGQIPPPGTTPYKLNHLYTYVGNNPLNRIDPLGLFEYYGNWCGPNHTGGFDKPWDQLTSQEQQNALLPKDDLDSCCQIHDLCHADCRANHPCSETDRQDCLNRCDRGLANCAVGCQSGGNRRWMLERYMRGSNSGAGPNTPNCRMTGP
jgi:RHS repeat-associated protein